MVYAGNVTQSKKIKNQFLENWKIIASKISQMYDVFQQVKEFVFMLTRGIWKIVIGSVNK